MIHDNYPPGAGNDPRAPWNQEDEYIQTEGELLDELLETLESLTFYGEACHLCNQIHDLTEQAQKQLKFIREWN